MSDPADVVVSFWAEHRQQLRQSETQRSVLTNIVLVIVAALSGLMVQQRFASSTAPIAVLIIGLGLYGALSAAKYHERAVYHLGQARALTATLRDLGVLGDDANLAQFRAAHYEAFPRLHRIRLHWLWTGLHLTIVAYGFALGALVFV